MQPCDYLTILWLTSNNRSVSDEKTNIKGFSFGFGGLCLSGDGVVEFIKSLGAL